jgi:nucleoside 2-deoxyribosyltransferase
MTKVFISYSNKDRAFVQRLAADLTTRLPSVTVFYDMLIESGASWAQTLAREVESADVILAVLSPDYLTSEWARQEVNVGLAKQTRLIPILFRPCAPSGFLGRLTGVDFRKDYEEALARLVWGITGERPQATTGDQPGKPTSSLDPDELTALRREVQEAVRLFKSTDHARSAFPESSASTKPPGVRRCQCFIVMPFGDPELEVVYEDFVKPTLEKDCDLQCERGDDVFGSNVIMDDILRSIEKADVVLADLTRKNANVFYEIGICHALGKSVLLLAQSVDDVPFDLRHRRVLHYEYSPHGCERLENNLPENMHALLDLREPKNGAA